ncbi:MAG: tRNA lysidine(34) synthetase TilS [Hyphomicrobiales bacterium]|nr:tRNA lysidine(34) synthetase TilS [Hyphomicrobiales bacterium]
MTKDKNKISLDDVFSFVREKGAIIVAVSGGSDSLASLFLANAWAKKTGREIHAVTVDHGLRVEAAAEAAFVSMVCDGLDIVHTTLAWDGIKPVAGISAAARNARYDLMEEFARDIGVRIIITGHTCDDQAETVLMRLRRSKPNSGSSSRGHSGMCKRVLLDGGTLLLRPFLKLSRDQLRAYLNDVSQSWIEDPTNHDESFERVRVRRELEHDHGKKLDLLNYSAVVGRMRKIISSKAAELLAKSCVLNPGHVFHLNTEILHVAPFGVVLIAVKTVIAAAGGGQYLVSDEQLQQVLECMNSERTRRVTLGNCIIEGDKCSMQIYREARNLNSSMIGIGESLFWDGRVHVSNDSTENIRIEAMSQEYLLAGKEDKNCKFGLARKSVLLSSPLIIMESGLTIPLHFDRTLLPAQLEVRTGARAIENFCPEWDFALLDWLKSIDIQSNHPELLFDARRKNLKQ